MSESCRLSWGQEEGRVGLDAGLELVQSIPRLPEAPTGNYWGWVVPGPAIPRRGRGSGRSGSPAG